MPADPTSLSPRRRDSPQMYAGIVLLFAPVGVLMMMVNQPPLGWLVAIIWGVMSGLEAAGWAHTFIRRRWWLALPLTVAPMVVPNALVHVLSPLGVLEVGMGPSTQTRLLILAVMCVVLTSFGFMLSVVHLRRSESRTARVLAELDLARQVHRALAPPITLSTPIAQVFGRSIPSSTMGGDLIDAVEADGGVDVLLGDVSGHGVAAGVVMAMLKGCLRTRLLHSANLREVVSGANTILAELTAPNMFATLVALRLRAGGRLEYALAGHLPIFHYRAAAQRWEFYPNQNLPLGIDALEPFISGSASLAPGDTLAVFTDGLSETQDHTGRELRIDGVLSLLARGLSSDLAAMHQSVLNAVAAHGPQLDDQSLVLVRVV